MPPDSVNWVTHLPQDAVNGIVQRQDMSLLLRARGDAPAYHLVRRQTIFPHYQPATHSTRKKID